MDIKKYFKEHETEIDNFIETTARSLALCDLIRLYSRPLSWFQKLKDAPDPSLFTKSNKESRGYTRCYADEKERLLQLLKDSKNNDGYAGRIQAIYFEINDIAYELALLKVAHDTNLSVQDLVKKPPKSKRMEVIEKHKNLYDNYFNESFRTISQLMNFDETQVDKESSEKADIEDTLCRKKPVLSKNTLWRDILYTFDINGATISVIGQEVLGFYGQHHGLTQKEIAIYAPRHVAQMKYHRICGRYLDKVLVERLIKEERLMKAGESDSFNLQLTFAWHVELKKEADEHPPFKYVVNAWCLDNAQNFSRRYVTMQTALLHCLNGFNENVAVRNRYASIKQYLNDPSCK